MNIKRIIVWIVMVAISVSCMCIDYYIKNKPEKENITICIDKDSKYIVDYVSKKIKREKNIIETYEINNFDGILTSDISVVESLKSSNSNIKCEKMYTTPLIVVVDSDNIFDKLDDSATFLDIENYNNYTSINFNVIIDAIINDKKWSELGVKKNDNLVSVVCPQRNTVEGKLFEKFLIVTLNKGIYPTDENIYENIKTTIEKFYSKSTVIQCDNTSERLKNVIDPKDRLYVVFENSANTISNIKYAYPSITVLKSFYYLYENDAGKSFISSLKENEKIIFNNLVIRTQNLSGVHCYYRTLSSAIYYVDVE